MTEWRKEAVMLAKARAAYMRAYRKRHRRAGLCVWCTAPAADNGRASLCERHLLSWRVRRRGKGGAWIPGGPGRKPLT